MTNDAVEMLRGRLGPDRVATDTEAIDRHCHDQWVLSILRRMEGRAPRPACVVLPRSTAEVATVLEIAEQTRTAVVPFGAGSGVCGGAVGPPGALVVDLRGMNRLLELDRDSLFVRCEAGVLGRDLERRLGERGVTMGHFPQSIDISTVGGWAATRSSGQFSTKYGGIEDMLLAFEAVLPGGKIVRTRPVPRCATGADVRALFLGSEGTLGILTELTFRVHRAPEATRRRAFAFGSFHDGLEAIREGIQDGWRPAVMRLYDQIEASRNFAGAVAEGRALLLVLSEGPRGLVDAEAAAVADVVARAHGEDCGEEPVVAWLADRNHVPTFESFLERGIVVDTIEVATTWDRIHRLYDGVLAGLRAVDGVVVASGHSSHAYAQGTNVYFTFAARPDERARAEDLYFRCWSAAMEATLAAGGTISHHHGVGRLRTRWMRRELGSAYDLLLALKRAFDPSGIMNPGVLVEP